MVDDAVLAVVVPSIQFNSFVQPSHCIFSSWTECSYIYLFIFAIAIRHRNTRTSAETESKWTLDGNDVGQSFGRLFACNVIVGM